MHVLEKLEAFYSTAIREQWGSTTIDESLSQPFIVWRHSSFDKESDTYSPFDLLLYSFIVGCF